MTLKQIRVRNPKVTTKLFCARMTLEKFYLIFLAIFSGLSLTCTYYIA